MTLSPSGRRIFGSMVMHFSPAGDFSVTKTVEADIEAQNGATDMLSKVLKQLVADEHDARFNDIRNGGVNRRSVRKTIDEIGQTVG